MLIGAGALADGQEFSVDRAQVTFDTDGDVVLVPLRPDGSFDPEAEVIHLTDLMLAALAGGIEVALSVQRADA